MKKSLNRKIVGFMILVTAACAVIYTVLFFATTKSAMVEQIKNDGYTMANMLSLQLNNYGMKDSEQIKKVFSSIKDKNLQNVDYISLVDENLKVLVDNKNVHLDGSDVVTAATSQNKDEVDGITSSSNKEFIDKTINNRLTTAYEFKGFNGNRVINISAPVTLKDGYTCILNIGVSLKPLLLKIEEALKRIIIITVIIQIINIVVSMIIGKYLTKSLGKITSALKKIEENDLSVEIDIKSNDEIGILAKAINNTVKNLRDTIVTIKNTSDKLKESAVVLAHSAIESSSATEEISSSVEEVSGVIDNQNADISHIATTFDEFSKNLDSIIKETYNIINGNTRIKAAVGTGNDELNILINSINDVRSLFGEFIDNIKALDDRIMKINGITDIINEISEQTNLLSLNASIEAARVGAAGTGFGVVAGEIRSLSEQVAKSSNSINDILKVINKNTKEILNGGTDISQKMNDQIKTIEETVDSFTGIHSEIENNIEYVNIVSNSIKEIDKEKDTITVAVNSISNISSDIAASSQEITATIVNQAESAQGLSVLGEDLSEVAEELNVIINKFKL